MAINCSGCGIELVGGQHFCQRCGRPTADFETNRPPIQGMPPGPAAPEKTSQYSETGATGPAQGIAAPAAEEPDPVPRYMGPDYWRAPTGPYYPTPPAKRGPPWGLIVSIAGAGVFVGRLILGALMAAWPIHTPPDTYTARTYGNTPVDRGGDQAFDTPPIVTGVGVTLNETFPLNRHAALSVSNVSGDITVETWDQEQAQVTVTKTGGSSERRAYVGIVYNRDRDRLNLKAGSPFFNLDDISVKFDIKVPPDLKELIVNSEHGEIRISGLDNQVTCHNQSGSIHLRGLKGGAVAKAHSGSIDAIFDSVDDKDALDFSSVSGSISLEFKGPLDARLDAKSYSGNISIDRDFGVNVDKAMYGLKASGNIGNGGRVLAIETTSGSILVRK
jgi:hypothetical protein